MSRLNPFTYWSGSSSKQDEDDQTSPDTTSYASYASKLSGDIPNLYDHINKYLELAGVGLNNGLSKTVTLKQFQENPSLMFTSTDVLVELVHFISDTLKRRDVLYTDLDTDKSGATLSAQNKRLLIQMDDGILDGKRLKTQLQKEFISSTDSKGVITLTPFGMVFNEQIKRFMHTATKDVIDMFLAHILATSLRSEFHSELASNIIVRPMSDAIFDRQAYKHADMTQRVFESELVDFHASRLYTAWTIANVPMDGKDSSKKEKDRIFKVPGDVVADGMLFVFDLPDGFKSKIPLGDGEVAYGLYFLPGLLKSRTSVEILMRMARIIPQFKPILLGQFKIKDGKVVPKSLIYGVSGEGVSAAISLVDARKKHEKDKRNKHKNKKSRKYSDDDDTSSDDDDDSSKDYSSGDSDDDNSGKYKVQVAKAISNIKLDTTMASFKSLGSKDVVSSGDVKESVSEKFKSAKLALFQTFLEKLVENYVIDNAGSVKHMINITSNVTLKTPFTLYHYGRNPKNPENNAPIDLHIPLHSNPTIDDIMDIELENGSMIARSLPGSSRQQ